MRLFRRAAAALLSAAAAASFIMPASAAADWKRVSYIGDLNGDDKITVADLVLLNSYLLGASGLPEKSVYDMDNAYYLTGVRSEISSLGQDAIKSGVKYLQLADMDQDGVIDTYDLIAMRQIVIDPTESAKLLYRWYADDIKPEYIEPPIYDLYGSMPSQGDAKAVVFSVEFPDCKFSYKASTDEVEQAVFGSADESSRLFPLESIAAFYERSSKGAIKLSGKAYEYTAQNPISYYEGDIFHVDIINEVLNAFDEQIDFSEFDADKDGTIDSIMIVVPNSAGKDDWWPTSGVYGGDHKFKPDGLMIGHVIVGNKTIEGKNDYSGFCNTYSHEMGHCMGLPDYYRYKEDDYQGMHGSGGFEMMDDAMGDFGAASKLMLGWYTEEQVNVFDSSSSSEQTFTLYNNETDSGNCVIIPRGTLADKYRSEFFIIEYTTLDNNNSRLKDQWWRSTGSGVRVYHVEASLNDNRTYPTFRYKTKENDGTDAFRGFRFIRLVNEGDDNTDNLFRDGVVIDSSTRGFMWYSSSGDISVDTGVSVSVSKGEGDSYNITVRAN